MDTIYDVCIIGCGAAGSSAAYECAKHNLKTVILEKGESHNMSIRKFYKEGKRVDRDYKGQVVDLQDCIDFKDGTKESTLDFFDNLLQPLPILYQSEVDSISPNKEAGFQIRLSDNRTLSAQFCIVAIGKMGQPNKPSYPLPPSVRKKINFNANDVQPSEKILVVGGGNSAVEYACDLAKSASNGGRVMLNYRRSEFTRINEVNANALDEAIKSGELATKLGIDITELGDNNALVEVNFSDGSKESFDRVIYAIGGASPIDFLQKCGIKTDEKGVPLCSDKLESSVPNIFVAGDIALKNGGSIALAVRHSHDIVTEIVTRLKS